MKITNAIDITFTPIIITNFVPEYKAAKSMTDKVVAARFRTHFTPSPDPKEKDQRQAIPNIEREMPENENDKSAFLNLMIAGARRVLE